MMLEALFNEFNVAATDEDIHVVILTGRGKYYCAGLTGCLKPMHPRHSMTSSTGTPAFV